MNGTQTYEKKINDKIENLINKNRALIGFRYFLGELAPSTIYNYLRIVNSFLSFAEKDPSDLVLDDYTIYLGSLRGKTSSYRITTHAALKKYSTYLLANQVNTRDPMQFVSRPKYQESIETEEKRRVGYLDRVEIKRMKRNVERGVGSSIAKTRQTQYRDRDMAIIMIFLSTGLRCSALCKLDIDNINYENHSLRVVEKGGKVKECILAGETWECVDKWLKRRLKMNTTDQALFLSNRRTRISTDAVGEIVSKYSFNITGKHITPHKLRATYGTQLYNATKDIYFVQKCMGHNSATTTQLYIRGDNNNTKQASEIMDRLLTN